MSTLNNPMALLKAMLARIPLILKTLVFHGLQITPASKKQDLRTEMTVAIIRSFLDMSVSVSTQQRKSMNDPGIKGPMWISKVTLPAPEDAVAAAVLDVVKTLSEGDEAKMIVMPPVKPVEAEWTGYRGGVDKNAPLPDISEKEKYEALKVEAKSDLVIFYIHGGALYLMDPCTHRVPVAYICKLTGARALNVRYRLAPQNPFPAALVDILTAYLSLIHPPEGSYHEPIPADKIIFAGDSAGGNLSLALLQTLLTLKRTSSTVQFHCREVSIDLPVGISLISPWCDITRSMSSVRDNAIYDYLAPPPHEPAETMYHPATNTPDSIWPTNPPRSDLYCNARLVAHPLVSPLACPKELWKGSPPIYIAVGEEGLTDEDLITARKIHHAGVPVIVEQYEGMPHVFGFIMIGTAAGKLFFQGWAQYLRDVLAKSIQPARGDVGKVIFHHAGWHSTKVISLDDVHSLSDAEVEKILRDSRDHRAEWESKLNEEWQAKARL
ncbi:lipase/esterase, putative [Talaromyces stipitatus ATCC 10500]|uniref:Lipase/esterase, putative n=1 Tax=Talaromyces stipitatus (strain ATCC 10500 / CBS 375.48 / QM 6759 / NRRL 1006) TaxID=441959 RepID=B8M6I7_TALSN|nr:lipase/esterase, putative [Talaromyces stipitatus ATCC 10500]EED19449.1 lipase/esterase, putative [Talaromyces stipitatus ATCC 10500]